MIILNVVDENQDIDDLLIHIAEVLQWLQSKPISLMFLEVESNHSETALCQFSKTKYTFSFHISRKTCLIILTTTTYLWKRRRVLLFSLIISMLFIRSTIWERKNSLSYFSLTRICTSNIKRIFHFKIAYCSLQTSRHFTRKIQLFI